MCIRDRLLQAQRLVLGVPGQRLLAVDSHPDRQALGLHVHQGRCQVLAVPSEGQDPDRALLLEDEVLGVLLRLVRAEDAPHA
eukprot:3317340-Alexandrium_andersonii.AAC.1